ncbi:MAG: RdgB/HAM1 family non-canonical purine NTP pyrophosphatase [Ghiorsea sp.]
MNISKLVIASNNAKKRQEIEAILADLSIQVLPAAQTIFVDVLEDGETFAENAKKKAIAFMQANKLPALADDSGLCVNALNGAPGVYSARFAGEQASDSDNNSKLLQAMDGETQREAHFVCALHLAFPDSVKPQENDLTAQGSASGVIIEQHAGDTGFGYDPLFFSSELGKTFAQASAKEKSSVSHRGRALRLLADGLTEYRADSK